MLVQAKTTVIVDDFDGPQITYTVEDNRGFGEAFGEDGDDASPANLREFLNDQTEQMVNTITGARSPFADVVAQAVEAAIAAAEEKPRTLSQLAAATADEIERRGWQRGGLVSLVGVPRLLSDMRDEGTADAIKDCAVCALGGMAAAYFGNPLRGYDADGNGYDSFIVAVAAEIPTNQSGRTYSRSNADGVIYGWNDYGASQDGQDGKATVVEFFRNLAVKWAADEAKAEASA